MTDPDAAARLAARARAESVLVGFLEGDLAAEESVAAVVRDDDRWLVRLTGIERDYTTVWFHLGDHTVSYDVQFLPAPVDNLEALYELLLLRNWRLYHGRYCLTRERDVHLVGQLPLAAVSAAELGRIIGLVHTESEEFFRRALRLGYASMFPSG